MVKRIKKLYKNGEYCPIGSEVKTIAITLLSSGRSNNEQTLTATGVTASNTVVVSPDPSDVDVYSESKIFGSAQGTNTLTFTCETIPSTDIVVNVIIIN